MVGRVSSTLATIGPRIVPLQVQILVFCGNLLRSIRIWDIGCTRHSRCILAAERARGRMQYISQQQDKIGEHGTEISEDDEFEIAGVNSESVPLTRW